MKKLTSLIVILLIGTSSLFAQGRMARRLPPNAQIEYGGGRAHGPRGGYAYGYGYSYYPGVYTGFRIGGSFSSVFSDSDILNGSSPKGGLMLGWILGVPLSPTVPLDFETGLYYIEKGGKSTDSGVKFTYGLNYLEVPFVVKYNLLIANNVALQPFFGGFMALGVGGKIKDYGNRDAFDSYSSGYFRRGDVGLRLGCGLGMGVFNVGLSYDLGLANVGQDDFDDTRTGSLNIYCGVTF